MRQFLLDTNVISEPLRPQPARGVLRKLRAHENEIVTCSMVWHELRYGVARLPPSRRRDVVAKYLEEVVLAAMPILDYDMRAAEWHAQERARLAAIGLLPAFVDGQIAAIAKVHDLTVVTFNEHDFKRFGVPVVRW